MLLFTSLKFNMHQLCLTSALMPILVAVITADDVPFVKKLREDLLVKQKYNRFCLPVKNHTTQVQVVFNPYIEQILDLNPKTERLTVDISSYINWKDEHLTWKPEDYGGVKKAVFKDDEIWMVPIGVQNIAGGLSQDQIQGEHWLSVNSSGRVRAWLSSTVTVVCPLDLRNFPFDEQSCRIYFGLWSYLRRHVNITYPKEGLKCRSAMYASSPEWNVTGVDCQYHEYNWRGNGYQVFSMLLKMRRQIESYKYYVFIPYATGCLFTVAMFLLPIKSQLRFIFASFSLFILVTLLLLIGSTLGIHSLGTPYAARCIGINILLVVLSVAFTTLSAQIISTLAVWIPVLPSVTLIFTRNPIVMRLLCVSPKMNECKKGQVETPEDEENNDDSQVFNGGGDVKPNNTQDWLLIGKLLDRFLFIIYLISIAVYHT